MQCVHVKISSFLNYFFTHHPPIANLKSEMNASFSAVCLHFPYVLLGSPPTLASAVDLNLEAPGPLTGI